MLGDYWQTSARSASVDDAVEGSDPHLPIAARLTDLEVIRFQGSDVPGFLQGYLTIDLDRLVQDDAHLAALTNLQGRVVADGWVLGGERDLVDWIVHRSLTQRVLEFLAPYLALARTNASPRQDDHLVVGLPGQDAHPPRIRVIEDVSTLEELLAHHSVVDESVWSLACIEHRIALVSALTSEQFLPQMLGLVEAGAVDFDKGCYLGQEVVARAQHRGQVKRRLIRFRASAEVSAGDRLLDERQRDAGTVISCASTSGATELLAVVREPVTGPCSCDGAALEAV